MSLSKRNSKRYFSDSRKSSAKNNWYFDYYNIHFIICYVFCFNIINVIFIVRFGDHRRLKNKIIKLTERLKN